ncbi:hypothetical protein [Streptomyces sp. NPDC058084]|uniref:hypothetical protein n=1 Tax=Streptomyces sp. NPDC058084 TaxID=3346333 RepID=UPI0036EB44CC
MIPDSPRDRFQDIIALWGIGEAGATEVVDAACTALVEGLDSPTLRILAGVPAREADYDVRELLPAVTSELGLPEPLLQSDASDEAAAVAVVADALRKRMTPRDLAWRVHKVFSHRLPLVARLAELDDEYDTLEYGDRTAQEIDRDVRVEAFGIALTHRVPGRLAAIEAIWDGDTKGWMVLLQAILKNPQGEVTLDVYRHGTDIRVFNGQVPPWPEAEEAFAIGSALAERCGVPFHFASPDEPDDDAPRWWDA